MKNIDRLYKEWKSLQPIDNVIQDTIDRKFMLEFNYNSNHIEGNTLTFGQTELLLMFGLVDSDARMSDLEEMKAHNVCLKMIQVEALASDRPLTEYFIRELHHTLLREDYEVRKEQKDGTVVTYVVHAGRYKTRPNSVITPTGERFEYASPEETQSLMSDLVCWFNEEVNKGELSPIEIASLFHYRYIRIHPFEDGNGRIARLLVNYILCRADYPMIIIRSDDKSRYLSALNQSDINVGMVPSLGAKADLEAIRPFVDYMMTCLSRALTLRIKAAKGESIEEEDDWKKNIAIKAQIRKNKPARTLELSTKTIREAFVRTVDYVVENLRICQNICFSVSYNISSGSNYQYSFKIPEFSSYAEKTNFQNHVRLNILIRIAELLPQYNINATVECLFHEFEYEIRTKRNKTDADVIKLRYGETPSERQLSKLVAFIGNYIFQEYSRYCEDNE